MFELFAQISDEVKLVPVTSIWESLLEKGITGLVLGLVVVGFLWPASKIYFSNQRKAADAEDLRAKLAMEEESARRRRQEEREAEVHREHIAYINQSKRNDEINREAISSLVTTATSSQLSHAKTHSGLDSLVAANDAGHKTTHRFFGRVVAYLEALAANDPKLQHLVGRIQEIAKDAG